MKAIWTNLPFWNGNLSWCLGLQPEAREGEGWVDSSWTVSWKSFITHMSGDWSYYSVRSQIRLLIIKACSMGVWFMQLHRAPHSKVSHSWLNILLSLCWIFKILFPKKDGWIEYGWEQSQYVQYTYLLFLSPQLHIVCDAPWAQNSSRPWCVGV